MGFATGFEAGLSMGDRRRQAANEKEQLRQQNVIKQSEAADKAITGLLTSAQELASYQSQKGDMNDPNFLATYKSIVDQAEKTSTAGAAAGWNVTTPEVVRARAQTFLNQPSREQLLTNKEEESKISARGTAAGKAEGTPVAPATKQIVVKAGDDFDKHFGLNLPEGSTALVEVGKKEEGGEMFATVKSYNMPAAGDKKKFASKVAIDTTGKRPPINVGYDSEKNQYLMDDGRPMPDGYIATSSSLTGTAAEMTDMTNTVQSEVQKDIISSSDRLTQLERISSQFDEDYLRLPAKIKNAALNVKDLFGGLGGKDREFVEKYAMFQQDAIQVVNETINELTGAAMGVQEAERLRKQVPDPENDKATAYNAKLKNIINKFKVVKARREFLLRNGFDADFSKEPTLSIEQFEQHIEKTGATLADQYKKKNPKATPSEVREYVGQQLKQEFGL